MSGKILVLAVLTAWAGLAGAGPATAAPGFPDVSQSWAADSVSALSARGLVEGYPDGNFKGDRAATRLRDRRDRVPALPQGWSSSSPPWPGARKSTTCGAPSRSSAWRRETWTHDWRLSKGRSEVSRIARAESPAGPHAGPDGILHGHVE